MTFFIDWPLYAQIIFVLGIVMGWVPLYFGCKWLKTFVDDQSAARTRRTVQKAQEAPKLPAVVKNP